MSTQATGAPASVFHLSNSALQPVVQARKAGRLPRTVVNISTARQNRTRGAYSPHTADVSAFAADELVQTALRHMERAIVGTEYRVKSPADVAVYLRTRIGARDHEVFTVLFLNAQNRVLACDEMGKGTINQCPIYPREVARRALQLNATRIIVSHNHPSGSLKPSDSDYKATDSLTKALDLLDIEMLDHIIVSSTGAYSIKGGCHV